MGRGTGLVGKSIEAREAEVLMRPGGRSPGRRRRQQGHQPHARLLLTVEGHGGARAGCRCCVGTGPNTPVLPCAALPLATPRRLQQTTDRAQTAPVDPNNPIPFWPRRRTCIGRLRTVVAWWCGGVAPDWGNGGRKSIQSGCPGHRRRVSATNPSPRGARLASPLSRPRPLAGACQLHDDDAAARAASIDSVQCWHRACQGPRPTPRKGLRALAPTDTGMSIEEGVQARVSVT